VLQGEREMARDNRTLGRFQLVGIPPAPRGVPQIEVTFDIDANGIVNVSAKDLGTGKEQKITITSSSGLAEEEIRRMVTDAESNAADDKARRETVETRNRLDGLVYSVEKTLSEHKEKLSAAELGEVNTALEEAKKALESEQIDALKGAADKLEKATHRLAEVMYRDAAKEGAATPGGGDSPGEGEVIDAEVVDTDARGN
jgi:molecular chaperone DnaK